MTPAFDFDNGALPARHLEPVERGPRRGRADLPLGPASPTRPRATTASRSGRAGAGSSEQLIARAGGDGHVGRRATSATARCRRPSRSAGSCASTTTRATSATRSRARSRSTPPPRRPRRTITGRPRRADPRRRRRRSDGAARSRGSPGTSPAPATPSRSRQGAGAAKQVTLNAAPRRRLHVPRLPGHRARRRGARGDPGRSPSTPCPRPPPVITGRPANPTATPAVFAWTTETGAFSRWQVSDGAGAVGQGPVRHPGARRSTSAPSPRAATPSGVSQIDAAGNVSTPASEAFTVQLPAGVAVAAPSKPRAVPLPTQNAGRLTPRAGTARRRPSARSSAGRRGPAGTTLYNVQVFRVVRRQRRQGGDHHEDPLRLPARHPLPLAQEARGRASATCGACGPTRAAPSRPQPLGISNFCIVSSKVLRRNAARAKARQRARAQATGARVG